MRVINKPAGAATLGPYAYGSPAGAGGTVGGGTVLAQWIFEEASGNAVDVVNSISVPASGTIPRQMFTPYFAPNTVGAGTGTQRFATATDPTAMNLGTASFVAEAWVYLNCWATASEQYPCDFRQAAAAAAGFAFSFSQDGTVIFYVCADDGTATSTYWASVFTAGTLPADGLKKLRFIFDRSGANATVTLVYNGTSLAVKNLATITAAKTISPTAVNLGGRYDNNRNLLGIMKEVRVVSGTTTANSGGPGGG